MAKFFFPPQREIGLPGFFNVDAPVGAGASANRAEDVILVQFLFRCTARDTKSAARRDVYLAVPLSGVVEAKTIAAIRALQEHIRSQAPSTVVDGRVSPAKSYKYGAGFYTIGVLNEFSQRAFYDLWPRLDRMPGCPGQVREMVIRTLVGTRGGSSAG